MAAIKVIYTVRDESGESATTEVKIPSTVNPIEWVAFAVDMADIIGAVITGGITNVAICLDVDLSLIAGSVQTILGGSDVEEKGYFQFITEGGFPTKLSLPTLNETKVLAGSDAIDQTDADVAAFINAMVTGITPNATLVQPSDSRDEDIVGLTLAEERFVGRN